MNLVVTDTGPLLHLHQVGSVDLLAHMGNVQVTPTVWGKLQRHAPSFVNSVSPAWLRQAAPSELAMHQAAQWVNAQMLDAGEAEALSYAQETQADIFLTDDTAARTLGEALVFKCEDRLVWSCSLLPSVTWIMLAARGFSPILNCTQRCGCQPK